MVECVAWLGRVECMRKRTLQPIRHKEPYGAFTGATHAIDEIDPTPFFGEVLTDMVDNFALLSFRFQIIYINTETRIKYV